MTKLMTRQVQSRLEELGISIPEAAPPAANYVPYLQHDNLVLISGQLPMENGVLQYIGKVGKDFDVEQGQAAARLCAINVISQLQAACKGDLDKVRGCLKLTGFVNCSSEFTEHPKVINGASDLMIEIFGASGRHTRAAVGANSLPLGVAVEVEAIFSIG